MNWDRREWDEAMVPGSLGTEIDYAGLLWRGKWLILAGLVLGVLGALAFLHIATPRYSAVLQLVPTEQGSTALPGNISGLASLAGISLPRGQVSQFGLALETITGRDVAAAVAADRPLMQRLFKNQWDPRARAWRRPPDALRGVKDSVKSILAQPVVPWAPPGVDDFQKLLKANLKVDQDQKKSIATITFSNPDPAVARDVLSALYREADAHLRVRSDERTSAYVRYIARKLQEVTLVEHREVLAQALAEQERVLMFARSGQAFAADPLGTVWVSNRPDWPKAPLVLAAGIALGTAAGVGLVLAFEWWRWRRHRSGPAHFHEEASVILQVPSS